MVPFEYGAVCLSACFLYLCKKILFVSQRIFCLSVLFFCSTELLSFGVHIGARLVGLFFSLAAERYRELGQAQFGGQILITLRISAASALKDFRHSQRGEYEYSSGGSLECCWRQC